MKICPVSVYLIELNVLLLLSEYPVLTSIIVFLTLHYNCLLVEISLTRIKGMGYVFNANIHHVAPTLSGS